MKYYLLQKLLSGRTHLALGTAMLILQRSPALKLLANAKLLLPNTPVARILQSLALPAAAASIPHAVSGASTSTYSIESSSSEGLKVGVETDIQFSISIAPASWSVAGDIPPGLRITDLRQRLDLVDGVLASYRGLITGTPTQAGTYRLTLTPWEFSDGTGETAPTPLALTLVIAPGELVEPPPASPPTLNYAHATDKVELAWEAVSQVQYRLERSTDLTIWIPVTEQAETVDGHYRIQIPLADKSPAFHRLAPNGAN